MTIQILEYTKMEQKIAFIMRGVHGSGKTTIARAIAGSVGVIHSTEDYFYTNGVYRRDEGKLAEYHRKNFEAFCESLRQGIPIVICDNVNHRVDNYSMYVHEARKAGYMVSIVSMPHPYPSEAAARNVHGVTADKIALLIETWQPDNGRRIAHPL